MKKAWEKNCRSFGTGAAAVFDMNGLKAINDSCGHEEGDWAISAAAGALKNVFGAENLFRMGGDEFTALMPEKTKNEANPMADAETRTAEADI